jgi:hypothetical protein
VTTLARVVAETNRLRRTSNARFRPGVATAIRLSSLRSAAGVSGGRGDTMGLLVLHSSDLVIARTPWLATHRVVANLRWEPSPSRTLSAE